MRVCACLRRPLGVKLNALSSVEAPDIAPVYRNPRPFYTAPNPAAGGGELLP